MCGSHAQTQSRLAARLDAVIRLAGIPIIGVSIGNEADKTTWTVHPPILQAAAQPIINAFDPAAPAHIAAELDRDARAIPRHVRAQLLYCLRDKLQRTPTRAEHQAAIDALVQAYKDVGP